MQINLPEETIRDIEAFLASSGEAMNVEAFIDNSIQRSLFFSVVKKVHERNADTDPAEVDSVIDDAVKAARADNGKPRADRS